MLKQTLSTGTFEERFQELYRQAEVANPLLGRFMARLSRRYPGRILHAPLKKPESARAKLYRDESLGTKTVPDDPETLKDIARATVIYSDLAALYAAREFVRKQPEHKVIAHEPDAVKDRYQDISPEAEGYRDIKFFLGFRIPAGRVHLVELQLNMSTMLTAKKLEHPLYEILRRAGASLQPIPVMIPFAEAQTLGPRLRRTWVVCKQHSVLSAQHLAALQTIVRKFFLDQACSKPHPGAVFVSAHDVGALRDLAPELFQTYSDRALLTKIMTPDGLAPMMQSGDARGFTPIGRR